MRQRQEMLRAKGRRRLRIVPSKEDYLNHCAGDPTNGGVDQGSLDGGYYTRYTLWDFYPQGLTAALGANPYPAKRTWPGCPYAALRRGFRALGTEAKSFPVDVKERLRRLSDLYDRDLDISPDARDDQVIHRDSPRSEANPDDDHGREDETGDERDQGSGFENEELASSQTGAPCNENNQDHGIHSAKAGVAAPNRAISARARFSSQPTSAAESTKNNRLSTASTLVDNEVRFDNLEKYKSGSNDHVVRAHSYNCRNGLFQDVACPACVVERYDALGIQYLPKHEDPCTSLEDLEKYPGLEPVSSVKSKPRWRYGPQATSQEALDAKMSIRTSACACQSKV